MLMNIQVQQKSITVYIRFTFFLKSWGEHDALFTPVERKGERESDIGRKFQTVFFSDKITHTWSQNKQHNIFK